MNTMNQWQDVITALERENFKHEEAILLLREADLPNPGLFERIGMTIRDMIDGMREHLHRQQTTSHHTNRATAKKFVT